jgi:hypothetical protein
MTDAAVERKKETLCDSLSFRAFVGIRPGVILGTSLPDKTVFAAHAKPCGAACIRLIPQSVATPPAYAPAPGLAKKLSTIAFVANSIPLNMADGFAKGEILPSRMMTISLPASRRTAAQAGGSAAKQGNAPDASSMRQVLYGKNEAEAPEEILDGSVDGDGLNICARIRRGTKLTEELCPFH